MRNKIIHAALLTALLCSPVLSFADVAAVKDNLNKAREALVALVDASDKAAMEKQQAVVKEASTKVDEALKDSATADKLKGFADLWAEFKKTRDDELIPAALSGDKAKAKSLATGVQKERFEKLSAMINAAK